MSGRVVVVGGGASAVAVVVALARVAPGTARVTVVDRSPRPGRGIAYDAAPGLRVNASRVAMSVDADDAEDLVRWLDDRDLAGLDPYVDRETYGAYLQQRLFGARVAELRVERDVVADVRPHGPGWRVALGGGEVLDAASVVLAVGHAAPAPLVPSAGSLPRWSTRVWGPGALEGIDRRERVLVIGTGLTAADAIVQLRRADHRGSVIALSRLGTWPLAHPTAASAWDGRLPEPGEPPDALLDAAPALLATPERAAAWADAVRARLPALWAAWTPAERATFATRCRGVWDRVRHRLPAGVLHEIRAHEAEGRLRTLAGTVTDVHEGSDGLVVTLRTPAGARVEVVDRVLQCTGPAVDPAALGAPITGLLDRGDVVADPARIGLVTDERLRLVAADGRAWPDLLAIGPITRPLAWETIGIPEIVRQAKIVAASLATPVG